MNKSEATEIKTRCDKRNAVTKELEIKAKDTDVSKWFKESFNQDMCMFFKKHYPADGIKRKTYNLYDKIKKSSFKVIDIKQYYLEEISPFNSFYNMIIIDEYNDSNIHTTINTILSTDEYFHSINNKVKYGQV